MANLFEVPFGRYYGTVDSTPLYVVLANAYYERTGDRELIEKLWPNIRRALTGSTTTATWTATASSNTPVMAARDWCSKAGRIPTILFSMRTANRQAAHRVVRSPGLCLCGKAGAGSRLATLMNDAEKSASFRHQAHDLSSNSRMRSGAPSFPPSRSRWTDTSSGARVRASNAGHCLYSGIASRDHAALVAQTLLSKDFFTGWGVRTVAQGESRYNPLSYHNGSVWPHDNGIIVSRTGEIRLQATGGTDPFRPARYQQPG